MRHPEPPSTARVKIGPGPRQVMVYLFGVALLWFFGLAPIVQGVVTLAGGGPYGDVPLWQLFAIGTLFALLALLSTVLLRKVMWRRWLTIDASGLTHEAGGNREAYPMNSVVSASMDTGPRRVGARRVPRWLTIRPDAYLNLKCHGDHRVSIGLYGRLGIQEQVARACRMHLSGRFSDHR